MAVNNIKQWKKKKLVKLYIAIKEQMKEE